MLNKACEILAKEGIDIRALTVAETIDFGLLRLITDKPDKAVAALNKGGLSAIEHEVLAVEVDDSPGGLAKITGALLKEKINIEYAYAYVSRKEDKAYVVLRTDDLSRAQKVLEKAKVAIISDQELESI